MQKVGDFSSSEHTKAQKNKYISSQKFHSVQTSNQILQLLFFSNNLTLDENKNIASLSCHQKQQQVILPYVPNSHNRNGWNRYSPVKVESICLQKNSQSLQKETEVIQGAMVTHLSNSFGAFSSSFIN